VCGLTAALNIRTMPFSSFLSVSEALRLELQDDYGPTSTSPMPARCMTAKSSSVLRIGTP
jgi:hypothetical protein